MNFEILIPITLFVCITYAIKSVVDARVRRQLVGSNVSQELVQSIIEGDELRRRHASLRWGIVLVALAIALAVIEGMDWREVTPGVVALLLGATAATGFAPERPVIEEILIRLELSLEVAILATIFATLISIPLGTVAALFRNTWI